MDWFPAQPDPPSTTKRNKTVLNQPEQPLVHKKSLFPPYKTEISSGPEEIRISNPNSFAVAVAVRSGDQGKDFNNGNYGIRQVR